nr:aminotransferase class V-fold PLP-dependent enzyme [Natronospira proteinivora]
MDCAATTPLDPRVREVMLEYFDIEYGNAGSRTHMYGQEAAKAVRRAREQIGAVVNASPMEVIFTSGATESNNIVLLGCSPYARSKDRRHIVTTAIEHKAVLEPMAEMERQGFEIDYIYPGESGRIDTKDIVQSIRSDTALVSVMHINNETGVIQPIDEIADELPEDGPIFHVDAAQGFTKDLRRLRHPRIDAISASAHKICGPKGVGALILRARRKASRKLTPLFHGGRQERGLRAGTLPVPLIAAFGYAAELATTNHDQYRSIANCRKNEFRQQLKQHHAIIHGTEPTSPYIINFSIPNLDSEALILAVKHSAALATGSACTSTEWKPSHVISAMYKDGSFQDTACRASWCHMTPPIPSAFFSPI